MLTREQIEDFARMTADGPFFRADGWAFVLRLGLARFDETGRAELTPAGRDLLATVPHLPAVEPARAAEISQCSRCHGSREVPLFMGPLSGGGTMPCPTCTTTDDADVIDASFTVVDDPWSDASCDEISAALDAGTMTSEEARARLGLSGAGGWALRVRAGIESLFSTRDRPRVREMANALGMIDLATHETVYWAARGNVYLRRVNP